VSEVLDSRQVSNAQLPLGGETFDAAEAIDVAVEACRPAIDRRHQTLEMSISRPLDMNGGRASLTQALLSLLTNASVYTHDGGLLRVAAEVAGGKLLLTVIDSGRGIAQHAARATFDPFVLDPHARLINEDGIDTRLTAVREIVQACGGTVAAATAAAGRGSQFVVSLPMEGTSYQRRLL